MAEKRNIRIDIEYDGTGYAGWQIQPDGPSVEGTLKDALERLLGHTVTVYGSGRTDAGVHAEGQVANFFTDRAIPLEAIPTALNAILPVDVSIIQALEVPLEWNARHDALEREYRYTLHRHPVRSALLGRRALHYPYPLDVEAMREAIAHLVGRHDFEAFRSSQCEAEHAVRTMKAAWIDGEGGWLHFHFRAHAFLRHQVRIMVGTLLEVGRGRMKPEDIKALLASGDRTKAGETVPSQGLTLVSVKYEERGAKSED